MQTPQLLPCLEETGTVQDVNRQRTEARSPRGTHGQVTSGSTGGSRFRRWPVVSACCLPKHFGACWEPPSKGERKGVFPLSATNLPLQLSADQ